MRLPRTVRLLYVGGFDFPSPHARAIQTLHTAHALARAGWEVSLLAQRATLPARRVDRVKALGAYGLPPHPRLAIVEIPVIRPRRIRGIDVHVRLAATNWSYGIGSLLWLLLHRRRADVILVRDPRLAWLFIQTRRIHGRPVIYEVHELFSTRPRENVSLAYGEVWGVANRTRSLEQSVLTAADLLMPLTRACANLVESQFGVARNRIAVVPDGACPPAVPVPPIDLQSRRVVYAGQLYAWKGVDTLIRAIGHTNDAKLAVIGGFGAGDPSLVAARALARQVGVQDRVELLGFVPHVDVRSRLEGARAGVVPLPDRLMSRYFTSPLKVFDYMAAGVPVVASDLPALREVLVDGQNALLVEPDRPQALADALNRLLDDAELAEGLRRRALDDVREYTWDRRADRIIEAVSSLVG